MNNWLDITDIFKWFPPEINNFAQTYGYEYNGANYTKYKYLYFNSPETYIKLYTAKNASHLGLRHRCQKNQQQQSLYQQRVCHC